MEFLLAAGADATTVTFNVRRETALHLAVQHAHVSCAERLMASTVVQPGGHSCRLANVISIGVRDANDTSSQQGLDVASRHQIIPGASPRSSAAGLNFT